MQAIVAAIAANPEGSALIGSAFAAVLGIVYSLGVARFTRLQIDIAKAEAEIDKNRAKHESEMDKMREQITAIHLRLGDFVSVTALQGTTKTIWGDHKKLDRKVAVLVDRSERETGVRFPPEEQDD